MLFSSVLLDLSQATGQSEASLRPAGCGLPGGDYQDRPSTVFVLAGHTLLLTIIRAELLTLVPRVQG